MIQNPRAPAVLRKITTGSTLSGCISAILCTPAFAGGFALIEHGASGLGHAYAGASAVSADTSTAWFNPAGMSEVQGRQFALGLHVLSTDSEFTNEGTALGAALGGGEVSGPDTASPGTQTALPNLYYVAPLNDQWNYGLSVGVPFGSSTSYDDNWVGRYTTVESGINVIDINPSLSYRLSDRVSLGFGVSLQRLSAELGSAVDSGAVCFGLASSGVTSISLADCINNELTPGNQANDSEVEITGDSVAFGFNAGMLFMPTPAVKLGLAYRHSVDHELDGDADFDTVSSLQQLLDSNSVAQTQSVTQATLRDGGAKAKVKLPSMLSLSGAWQTSEKLQLLTDITWTGWSSFEELRVVFNDPLQDDSASTQEWEDVWRFSAGLNYQYSDKLTLRAGYAFDEEPIPSPQRRTARIPGNDRTWFTVGAGYRFSPTLSLDVGYAFITLDETPIDNPNTESGRTGSVVRGLYDSQINILSAQLNWNFN